MKQKIPGQIEREAMNISDWKGSEWSSLGGWDVLLYR